jgi:monoamine oxidase
MEPNTGMQDEDGCEMKNRANQVAIFGGGVAGMSAAPELV